MQTTNTDISETIIAWKKEYWKNGIMATQTVILNFQPDDVLTLTPLSN